MKRAGVVSLRETPGFRFLNYVITGSNWTNGYAYLPCLPMIIDTQPAWKDLMDIAPQN